MSANLRRSLILLSSLLLIASQTIWAEDWPQWRGPLRDGKSTETGLLTQWPEGGPKPVWEVSDLGSGYGTVAIRDGRIFLLGVKEGDSTLFSLDAADGKILWTLTLGRSLSHERGGGPRSTPTLDEDRVYALAENGNLVCADFESGQTVWQFNILDKFGGRNPKWLISESPLVDGDRLIVSPGGPDAAIVALNKTTGDVVWMSRGLSDSASYSSSIITDFNGTRLILAFTAKAAVGLRASDGMPLWRYEPVANRTANVATPVVEGDRVFFSSAYRTGAALLRMLPDGDGIGVEEVYFTREMQNHHGGVILLDGHIYGFSNSILSCINLATGELVWRDRSVGKGSLTYADGHLYLMGEDNVVGLALASPKGYEEKGRFEIEDQGWPSWAHPVVSGGRLYIRNQGVLTRYDVLAP
ncbi:MAG: PQQ-like beta-propeller repeat protein [Acidobacteriota bacterium]|nr:MAG: PQQ-like beta-propeller repeat protein [Acidobacteriota bacterium]